jgi:hypothetical protein
VTQFRVETSVDHEAWTSILAGPLQSGPPATCKGIDNGCTLIPAGDGDCDSDNDCAGNLVCGTDNCEQSSGQYDSTDDCCMASKYRGESNLYDFYFGSTTVLAKFVRFVSTNGEWLETSPGATTTNHPTQFPTIHPTKWNGYDENYFGLRCALVCATAVH